MDMSKRKILLISVLVPIYSLVVALIFTLLSGGIVLVLVGVHLIILSVTVGISKYQKNQSYSIIMKGD